MIGKTNVAGENLTAELTEQEQLIQEITESLVGKVYGANATPETILKGYSAYVRQELVEGTLEVSSYEHHTVTIAETLTTLEISHSLGRVPIAVFVTCNDPDFAQGVYACVYPSTIYRSNNLLKNATLSWRKPSSGSDSYIGGGTGLTTLERDKVSITPDSTSSATNLFTAGVTYDIFIL